MTASFREVEKTLSQTYQFFSKMRHCQAACVVATTTGVGLIALGLTTQSILGSIALGTGAVTGYFAYNSYQVLTNLQEFKKQPSSTISSESLKKNTLLFDWAAESILPILFYNKISPEVLLDAADYLILETVPLAKKTMRRLSDRIIDFVQKLNPLGQSFFQMRPCQVASVAGLTASLSLAILGLAVGGSIEYVALIAGGAIGYLSYNSYQVFTFT